MKKIIFFLMFCLLSSLVYATEGDLLDQFDVSGDGNGYPSGLSYNANYIDIIEIDPGLFFHRYNHAYGWQNEQGIGIIPAGSAFGMDDNESHLFVIDAAVDSIRIYDIVTRLLHRSISTATGTSTPYGVCVNDSHVFVTSSTTVDTIAIFNMTGSYQRSITLTGGNVNPVGCFIDDNDVIRVVDRTADAVFKYYMNSTQFDSWNLNGANTDPFGMDGNGTHIFITDYTDDEVYIYEQEFIISDTTPPVITLEYPANNSILSEEEIFINVSINENGLCSLNNSYWNLDSNNATFFSFLETTTPNGNYNILIECNDTLFNTGYYMLNLTKAVPSVSILSPPDNATIKSQLLNLTFQFSGFNPNICTVYHNFTNETGFTKGQNITAGEINETNCTNETIDYNVTIINFYDNANYAYYKLDELAGNNVTDSSTHGHNGTAINMEDGDWITGKLNNALRFDGVDEYVDLGAIANFERTDTFSFDFWLKTADASAMLILTKQQNVGIFRGWNIFMEAGKIKSGLISDNTGSPNRILKETTSTYNNNAWRHVAITYDGSSSASGLLFYVDGSPVGTTTTTDTLSNSIINVVNAQISGRDGANVVYNGDIDEVGIYNFTLSQANITVLFNLNRTNITTLQNVTEVCNITGINQTLNQSTNYTFNVDFQEEGINDILYFINCKNGDNINSSIQFITFDNDYTPPVITIIYPQNLTYNTDMNITATINEDVTCSINETAFTSSFDNGTYFLYEETTLLNDYYSILLNCSDPSSNYAIQIINFTKDKEFPIITYINPSPLNVSVFASLSTLYLKINVTEDRDLYNFYTNITYYDSNLEQYLLLFEEEINISGTSYKYINPLDTTTYPNNTIILSSTRTCDSHTNNKLEKIKEPKKDKDYIKFDLGATGWLRIEAEDSDSIEYEKKNDRYSYTFKYKNLKNNKHYKIKTNERIVYLKDSKYKGHFIIYDGNKPAYWLDFDGDSDIAVSYDNGTYIIDSYGDNLNDKFDSIGELNCITGYATFTMETIEEPGVSLLNFNISTTANVLLIFTLLILYLGLMMLGFTFKNFGFASFGFVVGIILGMLLSTVHIIMTLTFFLLNISIFVRYALNFR